MLHFADIWDDKNAAPFFTFLLCLVILFVFIEKAAAVLKLFKKPEEPRKEIVSAPVHQPLIVEHAPQYVTISEFQKLEHKVDVMQKTLPEMETRLSDAGEQRALEIHKRFNPVAGQIEAARVQSEATANKVDALVDIVKAALRRKS